MKLMIMVGKIMIMKMLIIMMMKPMAYGGECRDNCYRILIIDFQKLLFLDNDDDYDDQHHDYDDQHYDHYNQHYNHDDQHYDHYDQHHSGDGVNEVYFHKHDIHNCSIIRVSKRALYPNFLDTICLPGLSSS